MTKPHIVTAAPGSLSWHQLRSVSGIGGHLKSVGIAGGTVFHYVRITIDGQELVQDYLSGTLSSPSHSNTSLSLDLPFHHDFAVDIRDAPSSSPGTTYWCVYMTNGSELIRSDDEIVVQDDGMEYLYRREIYRTDENVEYSTRGLIGPNRVSRIRLADDVVRRDTLQGSVHLESPSPDVPIHAESVDLALRFPGLQSELVRIPIGEIFSERGFEVGLRVYLEELVSRFPPFPVAPTMFEVATAIPGFANIPTRFAYLPY